MKSSILLRSKIFPFFFQEIINKVSQLEKLPDNQRDYNSLLFHDQLLRSQGEGDVFCHFREYILKVLIFSAVNKL